MWHLVGIFGGAGVMEEGVGGREVQHGNLALLRMAAAVSLSLELIGLKPGVKMRLSKTNSGCCSTSHSLGDLGQLMQPP